jgi:hypothetical protein
MISKSKFMLIGTVTALLVSGASLAMAETGYGGPNGSQPLVTAPAGGPAYAAGEPAYAPTAPAYHHTIKHHRSI